MRPSPSSARDSTAYSASPRACAQDSSPRECHPGPRNISHRDSQPYKTIPWAPRTVPGGLNREGVPARPASARSWSPAMGARGARSRRQRDRAVGGWCGQVSTASTSTLNQVDLWMQADSNTLGQRRPQRLRCLRPASREIIRSPPDKRFQTFRWAAYDLSALSSLSES